MQTNTVGDKVHGSDGEDIDRTRSHIMGPRSWCLSTPPTSRYSPQESPGKSGYRTSTSYESIPNLERTRDINTIWNWDETGLVGAMTSEYGGDVECN